MISRMEPRSTTVVSSLFRSIQPPISGRISCPAMNGSNNCTQILITELAPNVTPLVDKSSAAKAGVSTTPSMLETDAAQIAAGTLPRAMAVNAIDDCTVDG